MSEQEEVLRRKTYAYAVFALGRDGIFVSKITDECIFHVFHVDDVSAPDRDAVREGATFQHIISTVKRRDGRIEHRSELVFDRGEA